MNKPTIEPPQRTSAIENKILRYLAAVPADYTTAIAHEVLHGPSTTRAALDRLERDGLVTGVKHDERNTGGRIRVYWSLNRPEIDQIHHRQNGPA